MLDHAATASLRITYPNGRAVTRTLAFDGAKHFFSLKTGDEGVYRLSVTYTYGEMSYTYDTIIEVAYLPEYDAFVSCDRYNVYQIIRDNGETVSDGIPNLENDSADLATFKQSFIVPLLITAVAIFLLDVVVRKLRKSKKRSGKAA